MARVPGLYRRGNVWRCKYYVNGRPMRESTHIVSPADLQEAARKLAGTFTGTVGTPEVDARHATV